ncbi:MAG TPA: hypothetical protein VGI81_26085 [Tepidisphaeraceae bacterium]|jgi:hypothetical protein
MMCPESNDPSLIVAAEVSKWVEAAQALQAQVQMAMEEIRLQPGLSEEAQRLIEQLMILLRQRQAQAPTPDMVRTWVRVLSKD